MVFGFLLFFKLDYIPGLYTDETNYMNEVISKAHFGTDIHGLKNPIYFASVWGQGQSILYAWIVTPLIKLFGFSIFLFRFPMALLTLVTILSIVLAIYFTSDDKWLSICITLAMVTTPWFLISGRWVLDANISPIFVTLGLVTMYLAMVNSSSIGRYLLLLGSAALLSLSAYGYVASWIYLPFLIIGLLFTGLIKKWFSLKEMFVWAMAILILVLPLIVFAYRVNVQHIDKFSKFMFFDLPYLQANRVSSLISTKGSILSSIKQNVFMGINQINLGSDNLPQNSTYPYGVIFPFMLAFTAIGLFGKNSFLNTNVKNFRIIILESLLAFIPGVMVIRPNYNHWNFLWFPLAVLTGYGVYLSFKAVGKVGKTTFILLPLAVFMLFAYKAYFGFNNQITSFNNSSGSMEETAQINKMMTKDNEGHKLYIKNLSSFFNTFRLVQKPINSSEYVSMEKVPRKNKESIVPSPQKDYGYLRDLNDVGRAESGDSTMLFDEDMSENGGFLSDKSWHFVKHSYFNHRKVEIFKKE